MGTPLMKLPSWLRKGVARTVDVCLWCNFIGCFCCVSYVCNASNSALHIERKLALPAGGLFALDLESHCEGQADLEWLLRLLLYFNLRSKLLLCCQGWPWPPGLRRACLSLLRRWDDGHVPPQWLPWILSSKMYVELTFYVLLLWILNATSCSTSMS